MIAELKKEELEELYSDDYLRVEVAKQSFFHFITLYLGDQFELAPADFHYEMIDDLDSVDELNKYLAIIGFRGSAKSTIIEAFALWSMLNDKHNYIVWIGNTMDDSRQSLANIRNVIEESEDLQKDFDIELEDSKSSGFRDKWSESQMTLRECTIQAKSTGAKLRGVKFKKHRIDLIVADDLEDVKDAETLEKRMKTRKWFFGEVINATKQGVQAENVKVVMIGNKVHKDCLLMHLSRGDIVKTHEFGLYDADGNITWKAKYPDEEAVQKERAKVMLAGEGLGAVIWAREFLLEDIDEEDLIIKLSEFQYYPDEWLQRKSMASGVGIDFAISQKQTADYTAMVKGQDIKNDDGELRLCIGKNNVQQRMGFEQTINKIIEIDGVMPHGTKYYPEDVGYQKAAIEIMKKKGLQVFPQKANGDKRSRITAACFYIKTGRVLFPKTGAEDVINNLVGFGTEAHDDLADACAYLILAMVKKKGGILVG